MKGNKMQSTKFVILDVETDGRDNVVDLGYCVRTRSEKIAQGGFLLLDVFAEKGSYYSKDYLGMADRREIQPTTFANARTFMNDLVNSLAGRVILCAYNASFDRRALNKTSLRQDGNFFFDRYFDWLDIWRAWANTAPKAYRELAPFSASGKYLSTTAENVYRFEFQEPEFVEDHTGEADAVIEGEIFDKVLKRKKRLPINDMKGMVWRDFKVEDAEQENEKLQLEFLAMMKRMGV